MDKNTRKAIHKRVAVLLLFYFLLPLLFNTGCKLPRIPEQAEIKYDIQGEWKITIIEEGFFEGNRFCSFVGTKKKGTVVPSEGISGVYKVGGEHGIAVDFYFWVYFDTGQKVYEHYTGNFIDENYMEGTGRYKEEDVLFGGRVAWGAHRITGEEAGN